MIQGLQNAISPHRTWHEEMLGIVPEVEHHPTGRIGKRQKGIVACLSKGEARTCHDALTNR